MKQETDLKLHGETFHQLAGIVGGQSKVMEDMFYMISTLIYEGKVQELNYVIKKGFQEYFEQ